MKIQKAIDLLAAEWLGFHTLVKPTGNVVYISNEKIDGTLTIVMVATEIDPLIIYPTEVGGFPVIAREGQAIVLE